MPTWAWAGFWGGVAGSALLIGAAAAWFLAVPRRAIAAIMAFGAGVLITDAVLGFALVKLVSDFKDTVRGVVAAAAYVATLCLVFGNFFVRYPQIPPYWAWAWWANPLQYSFGGLLVNEVYNNPIYYDADSMRYAFSVCYPDRSPPCNSVTLLAYGYWVAEDDGTDEPLLIPPQFVGILAGFAAVFALLGMLTLHARKQ